MQSGDGETPYQIQAIVDLANYYSTLAHFQH